MSKAQILLVEDDDVLRDVVERNLSARGHAVCGSSDVQDALIHLRSQKFDLIFLDINLPEQTGWDLLRALQTEGHVLQRVQGCLPVVVLSAVRVSPQRLAEFHPLAYLPKPFPMEAILRLAAEAAQRHTDGQYASEPRSYKASHAHEEKFYA
ncbi:MAG TPA: response regulator [Ktedonobacteraceae bacterium]|jgi:DNA-binding response OmpR family regulator|nr:response regulator [Ktedonobacteraceae bacterium]